MLKAIAKGASLRDYQKMLIWVLKIRPEQVELCITGVDQPRWFELNYCKRLGIMAGNGGVEVVGINYGTRPESAVV